MREQLRNRVSLLHFLDYLLVAIALGIFLMVVIKAVITVDSSHDSWWYHLPFAARLAGLVPASIYEFDSFMENRYLGFPVLFESLQGAFWRLTGRVEMASFVGLLSLTAFLMFLRLRFAVPLALGFLTLMAVPLIQIHTTSLYVDLGPNVGLAIALLLLPTFIEGERKRSSLDIAVFALSCAAAANGKMQLIPLVGLVWICGTGLLIRGSMFGDETSSRKIALRVLVLITITGFVFYKPIKNLVDYKNPFYPIALKVGPLEIEGLEGKKKPTLAHQSNASLTDDEQGIAKPKTPPVSMDGHIKIKSDPVLWLSSVLELGMSPVLGHGSWNLGSHQDAPFFPRYGGFFGWYMVFHMLLLAVLVWRRSRKNRYLIMLVAAATIMASLMPNATIHRYYMFWVLVFIGANLILLSGGTDSNQPFEVGLARLTGLVAVVALLVVAHTTYRIHLEPRFYSADDLISKRRDSDLLLRVEQQEKACIVGEEPQKVFMYAPIFNGNKKYRIKMGIGPDQDHNLIAEGCGDDWIPVFATGYYDMPPN